MEDGRYDAPRGVDSGDDPLFREPPLLFFDDEDDLDFDGNPVFAGSGAVIEYESWEVDSDPDFEHLSHDELLPNIGLFELDDEDLGIDEGFASNNGDALGDLGPSWTDERAVAPAVVLHPTPSTDTEPPGDTQWSSQVPLDYPPQRTQDDEPSEVDSERSFRRSRGFNRFLMALTVLVLAGITGAVYMYLNRNPTQQSASVGTEEEIADPVVPNEGEPVAAGGAATGSTATVLTGLDPVGIVTTAGTVRLTTATDAGGVAEYGVDMGIQDPRYVGLTDAQAFIVDGAGTAWRVNFRADPTPVKLVDLGAPGATTTYHFVGADDGSIYFTDSNGTLWSVDATDNAASVYSPDSPENAIAQLASNATTLYILTIGGDVYRHEHGTPETVLAYGPSNDNPATVSLAPTASGVVLTAGGGAVRIVEPSNDPPIDVAYKPSGDKAIRSISAGTGAAILAQSGRVVYAEVGSDDVEIYVPDGTTKPAASDLVALGNGTIAAVDAEGSLWTLDLAADNPSKIWDAASLGALAAVRPNQDTFAVIDSEGNVWSVPSIVGTAQQLSTSGDARSIATDFFAFEDPPT